MKGLVAALLALFALGLLLLPGAASGVGPLTGKVIALDAGHGGTELGAQYPANMGWDAYIYEKDVNLAVVKDIKAKLIADGAAVVLTREGDETILSRKQRVNIAIQKCKSLAGRKCDALVSVHHNGSTNPAYDGLLVIYNERQDLPLATAVHDALLTLNHPLNSATYQWVDEGLRNGGYGMTVFGHLISILTEGYYITNDWEAAQYCASLDSNCRQVLQGARTDAEATAIATGLVNYFNAR